MLNYPHLKYIAIDPGFSAFTTTLACRPDIMQSITKTVEEQILAEMRFPLVLPLDSDTDRRPEN